MGANGFDLEVLLICEAMVDYYMAPISVQELNRVGFNPEDWKEYDPSKPESVRLFDEVKKLEIEKVIPGGSPGNVSSTMAALGHNVGLVSAIGEDNNGRIFADRVSEYGIQNHLQPISGGENPFLYALFTQPSNERTFFAYTGCTPKIDLSRQFPRAKVLYLSGYEIAKIGDSVVEFVKRYKRANPDTLVAFDVAQEELVQKSPDAFNQMQSLVDILFVSPAEYTAFFGASFERYNSFNGYDNLQIIALREGSKGSTIFWRAGIEHSYTPISIKDDRDIVNTNGSGDGHAAGFLSAFLEQRDKYQCGRRATEVAEMVLKRYEPYIEKVGKTRG